MNKNQLTAVLALIKNQNGEILLAKRNEPGNPEVHKKWEFPGGKIEFGEDPENAVIREVKEETGLIVKIVRLLPKIYDNIWQASEYQSNYQVFLLSYECRIIGGELNISDAKISELNFFSADAIDYSQCLPKMKEIISLLKS